MYVKAQLSNSENLSIVTYCTVMHGSHCVPNVSLCHFYTLDPWESSSNAIKNIMYLTHGNTNEYAAFHVQ